MREYRTAVMDNRRWADFRSRPGDVFICTPAKCGTTWTQTIVANLLWPDGELPLPVMLMSPWIEAVFLPPESMLAGLEAQEHRRFMKSHTAADGIPWFDDAQYVFVGRDGRDAFMSLCNHAERLKGQDELNAKARDAGIPELPPYDGDPHAFFERWIADEDMFFHIIATWWERRQQPNLLLVHYSDLKADLSGEMKRIASFLGIEVPDADWEPVVDRCTFESMRRHSGRIGNFDMMFEGGAEGFLFKGTNGRWRDVLSSEELAAYDQRARTLLPAAAVEWLERGRCGGDPAGGS